MLGVKVQTYKENMIVVIVCMLIALGFLWYVFSINDGMNGNFFWIYALAFVLIVFILYLIFSFEITVYDNGISTKTFFVTKEMLWEDITRFTYGTTIHYSRYSYTITCHIRLENKQGQKIKITNEVDDVKKIAKLIIQYTLSPLCHKATDQYMSGAEVDFGLIKLSQSRGLKSKGLFRTIEVPLDQVIDYRIEKGQFYLFRQHKKSAAISASIRRIPNVFALLAMLDSILQRNTSAG
ncbi:MAG: DUF6585 family protein [Smithella sp.]